MPPELIQREANGIFYATHIEIMNLESSEDVSMNNSIQYASKNYLLPFEDVYDINFQYSFEMETQDVSSLNNLGLAGGFRGDSATVPTVLLDSRGNSVRTVEPSQTGIHLSVKELLEIAEKDNWLDEMQPTLGADLQRGTAGPYGRISGVELDLRLRCFSPGARPTFLGVDTMIQGPLCSLQVHGAQPNWVTREYVDTLHGKFRYTRAHGIQVKIEAEGEVRHFDLPMLFLFIVEAIVLMQVPATVCGLVARYGMGMLSCVYFGVIVEKFDLVQHFATAAIQLLSNIEAHSLIAHGEPGITLPQMLDGITRATNDMGETTLHIHDLEWFVRFCFSISLDLRNNKYSNYSKRKSLAKRTGNMLGKAFGQQRAASEIISWMGGCNTEGDPSIGVALGLGSFVIAACPQEQLAIDHLVKLFDGSRKVPLLEQVFLPKFLREHHTKQRHYKASMFISSDPPETLLGACSADDARNQQAGRMVPPSCDSSSQVLEDTPDSSLRMCGGMPSDVDRNAFPELSDLKVSLARLETDSKTCQDLLQEQVSAVKEALAKYEARMVSLEQFIETEIKHKFHELQAELHSMSNLSRESTLCAHQSSAGDSIAFSPFSPHMQIDGVSLSNVFYPSDHNPLLPAGSTRSITQREELRMVANTQPTSSTNSTVWWV